MIGPARSAPRKPCTSCRGGWPGMLSRGKMSRTGSPEKDEQRRGTGQLHIGQPGPCRAVAARVTPAWKNATPRAAIPASVVTTLFIAHAGEPVGQQEDPDDAQRLQRISEFRVVVHAERGLDMPVGESVQEQDHRQSQPNVPGNRAQVAVRQRWIFTPRRFRGQHHDFPPERLTDTEGPRRAQVQPVTGMCTRTARATGYNEAMTDLTTPDRIPAGATPEGDGIITGNGPVRVDAFIDFLCPFCRRFELSSAPTLADLIRSRS